MKILKSLVVVALLLSAAGVLFGAAAREEPLGSEENPIIWAFVPSGEMETVAAGGEAVADMIYDKTGYYIETTVATDYAGVVEALSSDPPEAHMASLNTFGYILAAERGVAEVELVATRYGSPTYAGQLIARRGSGIESVEDLEGKTFARPDPLSTSGWIIPMVTMRAAGINPEQDLAEIVDTGSHDAVVAAVYNEDVDVGATYVDARSTLEDTEPDVMDKIAVLATSEPIPNDGVQFHPSVSGEMREKIITALLEIADTEEGVEALKIAYSWAGLVERDDTFYDPFRQVLQASGINVEELMGE